MLREAESADCNSNGDSNSDRNGNSDSNSNSDGDSNYSCKCNCPTRRRGQQQRRRRGYEKENELPDIPDSSYFLGCTQRGQVAVRQNKSKEMMLRSAEAVVHYCSAMYLLGPLVPLLSV